MLHRSIPHACRGVPRTRVDMGVGVQYNQESGSHTWCVRMIVCVPACHCVCQGCNSQAKLKERKPWPFASFVAFVGSWEYCTTAFRHHSLLRDLIQARRTCHASYPGSTCVERVWGPSCRAELRRGEPRRRCRCMPVRGGMLTMPARRIGGQYALRHWYTHRPVWQAGKAGKTMPGVFVQDLGRADVPASARSLTLPRRKLQTEMPSGSR
ncbi:hypothetical protein CC85DRAFT_143256 [Cutaneotrichosporon oleaginosum]|uniref:Uncharacterized protein n=1 Tax=Cutaneotrichosporon oleaginosum TaxID=879819 RepID=A0A0J1AZK8_9TREE|nr:uncharacterized protein CC85DRAFT_143256 [Cutaneotrichosporon oleaginosum]KLT40774.1 hypothetical protein CC85DRAFT_143256 [Cutaneotrichosporon oleaginosum]TXT06770.1 hypothetical protein COLE_06101 [Cutaneotrichosporon oleaginosum]